MLAYSIGGLSPKPYHAFGLLYHAAACVFVYLVGLELMFAPGVAFAIAALFAVHPVHTEAVAWIAGIPDVACGAFYFASVFFFFRYRRTRRKALLWLSSGLFFGCVVVEGNGRDAAFFSASGAVVARKGRVRIAPVAARSVLWRTWCVLESCACPH